MTAKRPISAIIVLSGGFRQDRNGTHGVANLHARVCDIWHDRRTSHVSLESWSTRAQPLADKIAAAYRDGFAARGVPPKIALVGYSWANPMLDEVEARLVEYGIIVDYRAYIDPIIRLRQIWWSPLNVLALMRWGRFSLFARKGRLFVQANDRPAGRFVNGIDGGSTHVFASQTADRPRFGKRIDNPSIGHNHIDDHPFVHDRVIQDLQALCAGSVTVRRGVRMIGGTS